MPKVSNPRRPLPPAPRATATANLHAPEHAPNNPPPPPRPDYPRYCVEPGERFVLADVNPDESEHYGRKRDVADELDYQTDRIAELQARLYAERRQSLLIVLQALDTGGKDGTIRSVFQGVNPQGCQVWSFKAPSAEEPEYRQDFVGH